MYKYLLIFGFTFVVAFFLGYVVATSTHKYDYHLLEENLIELRDIHKRSYNFIGKIKKKSTSSHESISLIIDRNGHISPDSLKNFLIEDLKLHGMTDSFLSDIHLIIYSDSMFIDQLRSN